MHEGACHRTGPHTLRRRARGGIILEDCIIVGGGIAGLQAAIQLGRYGHRVLVIDGAWGRSVWCHAYHNVLGWPDGVSGPHLRSLGRAQAERFGVRFAEDWVETAAQAPQEGFWLTGRSGRTYMGRRLLLATGVADRLPDLPGLMPRLGLSVYVCPDCDGYEVRGRRTAVLGAGEAGARMAITLTDWTRDLVYIDHERRPLSPALAHELKACGIPHIEGPIVALEGPGDGLAAVRLADGRRIKAERAFTAFGGNLVHSALAVQLGVRVHDNGHIPVHPRTRETNVPGVWAAGDVAAHSEQVAIAMGDGAQVAIWIHKSLAGR